MGTEWALSGHCLGPRVYSNWPIYYLGDARMHHVVLLYCFFCGVGESVQSIGDVFTQAGGAQELRDHLSPPWPIGERGLPSNAVRQPVHLTKHGKPRGIPNANCKSTDVGWTGTPIEKLLTQTSKLGSDQTQSVRLRPFD